MRYWIGVASRDHVARGVAGGFCQLCHGKAQPLQRMSAGDWIIYYSPKEEFDGNTPCQRFTAIGEIGSCVQRSGACPAAQGARALTIKKAKDTRVVCKSSV